MFKLSKNLLHDASVHKFHVINEVTSARCRDCTDLFPSATFMYGLDVFDAVHLTLIISIGSYYFVEHYFVRAHFSRAVIFIIVTLLITAGEHYTYGSRNERVFKQWAVEENITDAYMKGFIFGD